MRISDVTLHRYRLPLDPPVRLPERTMDAREGLLIRLETPGGAVGWGDAAPLPGFSLEALEHVEAELDDLRATLRGSTLAATGADGSWSDVEVPDDLTASGRFAVDSALVTLAADLTGLPVPRILTDHPRPSVSLNALLDGDPDEMEANADALAEAGYRAVKVKVARDDPDYEAAAVRILHKIMGPGVALRLDANRGWSLDEAVAFAEDVRRVPIAYVEEPLANPDDLPAFARQTGLPYALDETTREIRPATLRRFREARAVVLKPTLLGGLQTVSQWARAAEQHRIDCVFSASYESGVGLRMLLALAAALGPRDVPAGLDTYRRLTADVLSPRLPLDQPTVDVEAAFEDSTVDVEGLG